MSIMQAIASITLGEAVLIFLIVLLLVRRRT